MLDGLGSSTTTQPASGVNGVGGQSPLMPSVPQPVDVSPAPVGVGENPVGVMPVTQNADQTAVPGITDPTANLGVPPPPPAQPADFLEFKKGPFDEVPADSSVIEQQASADTSAAVLPQDAPPVADFSETGQESVNTGQVIADVAAVPTMSNSDSPNLTIPAEREAMGLSMTKKQMLEAILRMQKDLLSLQENVVKMSDDDNV